MSDDTKKKSLTRQQIVKKLSEEVPQLNAKEALAVVDSVLDAMRESLAKGEEVKISGFGKFIVKAKEARMARNPLTGGQVKISARRVLRFKASDRLKEMLNESIVSAA